MIWTAATQRIHVWLRQVRLQMPRPEMPASAAKATLMMTQQVLPRASKRVHEWRRRVLLRKGARLQARIVDRQDLCSLAMLDADGLVVYWHDTMLGNRAGTDEIVGRHVAQFYAPRRSADDLAGSHLGRAFRQGASTEYGWWRRPNGAVYWGSSVVEPVLLRDGRLQGFTHITRAVVETRQQSASIPRTRRARPRKLVTPHFERAPAAPQLASALAAADGNRSRADATQM